MKLKIKYPDHTEAIDAEPCEQGFRLKGHSLFLPLGPGDVVTADRGIVTGVVSTEPVFMVEAYFPINTPAEHVRAMAQRWRAATYVTQPTALSVLISSLSLQWVRDVVEPNVWWVDLLRVPGQPVDYRKEVQDA